MEHRLEMRDGAAIVFVSGDIDVSQTLVLREVLAANLEPEVPRLVVDLSEVGFIDSAGIGLLVTAHRRAEQRGGRFALTGVNETVGHVLTLTRTDRLLTVSASLEDAVTAVVTPA